MPAQTGPSKRLTDLLTDARAGRVLVMGILNVTPDSFSDGGLHFAAAAAMEGARRMAADGAHIIDVGGESTRPGAQQPTEDEELRRVVPVVRAIAEVTETPVSVDTRRASVAAAALEAGAVMVNDVSGLCHDPAMLPLVARAGCPVCIMHMRGEPADMQRATGYSDVVAEVRAWLLQRAMVAEAAGVAPERIILDPGFGFAKTPEQNLALVRRLREIADLGYPVLMGASRKSTLGLLLGGSPPDQRLEGTAAVSAIAIANGASLIRVHDVRFMARVAAVAQAVATNGAA